MTEDGLHRAQIGAVLHHVGGATVPQHVRRSGTPAPCDAARTICHTRCRVNRRAPRAINTSAELRVPASTARGPARYDCNASTAARPSGTMRSLSPLPRTSTYPCSIFRSLSVTPNNSLTRSAPPYSTSSMARSLAASAMCHGSSVRGRALSSCVPSRWATATWAAPSIAAECRCSTSDPARSPGPAAGIDKTVARRRAFAPPNARRPAGKHMVQEAAHVGSPRARQSPCRFLLLQKSGELRQVAAVGLDRERRQPSFDFQVVNETRERFVIGAGHSHFVIMSDNPARRDYKPGSSSGNGLGLEVGSERVDETMAIAIAA